MTDRWAGHGWTEDLIRQVNKEFPDKPQTKRPDCEETLWTIYLLLKDYFEGGNE